MNRRALALIWTARLARVESDAIHYAWPPPDPEATAEAARLADVARCAADDAAKALGYDPTDEAHTEALNAAWREALDVWDGTRSSVELHTGPETCAERGCYAGVSEPSDGGVERFCAEKASVESTTAEAADTPSVTVTPAAEPQNG